MLDIPGDPEPHCCRPSALEQWARTEAKSDAMVEEVLMNSVGALRGNRLLRARDRWVRRVGFIAVALAAVALIGAAIVAMTRLPAERPGNGSPAEARDPVRRWGPFLP